MPDYYLNIEITWQQIRTSVTAQFFLLITTLIINWRNLGKRLKYVSWFLKGEIKHWNVLKHVGNWLIDPMEQHFFCCCTYNEDYIVLYFEIFCRSLILQFLVSTVMCWIEIWARFIVYWLGCYLMIFYRIFNFDNQILYKSCI